MEAKFKKCSKCGRELPNTLEYFFKCSNLKDGLHTQCKECQGYKFNMPKEKPIAREGYKICPHCNRELPATEEYFQKSEGGKYGLHSICKQCKNAQTVARRKSFIGEKKEHLLEISRKSWRKNKEKYALQNKKWRENNKEYVKEYMGKYQKSYYKNNKEKILEHNKEYYASHTEQHRQWWIKYKEKNFNLIKEKNRIYTSTNKDKIHNYYLQHKDQHRITNRKRKSLIKLNVANFSLEDWEECLKFFDYKDAYTGLPMEVISQDHVIPVSKGGAYVKQNIIPCESNINSSKNNSDMETWYRKQSFFSEERLSKIYKWMGVKDNTQQLKII